MTGGLAKLTIDNSEEIRVLECSFDFHRDVDNKGVPSSDLRGGRIRIVLESTTIFNFLEWMAGVGDLDRGFQNGKIVFEQGNGSIFKTLEFHNAVCVNYREIFSDTGNEPMRTEVVISAQEYMWDRIEFTNPGIPPI